MHVSGANDNERYPDRLMKVVVVGAGLGGLSAACHLVGRGHDVEVLERADVPGGRAGLWDTNGYRFDTGPSVLTMLGILRGAFEAAGADMDSMLTLKPVDPMYRAVFADGSAVHVRHGREAMVEEIRETAGPPEGHPEQLAELASSMLGGSSNG